MKIQRALISVSDKTGVVDFARALAEMGVEILSTGGTAKTLRAEHIEVVEVSDFTGFPEMLDGRVKTLHPKIHAGILHLRDQPGHVSEMKRQKLVPIDLVCVNLYPFESTVADWGVSIDEAIENIDIGGPTLLRAAAKNHKFVTAVTDPHDYARVIASLRENQGQTSPGLRLELAQKVFAQQARYDTAAAAYLARQLPEAKTPPPFIAIYADGIPLRYGENPHQKAVFYRDPAVAEACIAHAEMLHGKEMSFNNYVDADAALEAVRELSFTPAVAVIKHSNPCGYATGRTLAEAFEAAWSGDIVSAFGSVIATTVPVDLATATLMQDRFIEALVAPDFEPDALDFLRSKSKNIRLLKLHQPLETATPGRVFRQINGGLLVQDRDIGAARHWMVPTKAILPDEKRALADFGIKACKHVKSNAVVIVREYAPGQFAMLGMGAGQPNRVDALRKLALTKAQENIALHFDRTGPYGKSPKDFQAAVMSECVLVSDAFFPFADSIEHAAEAGIRWVVQPGGSKKDEEVIAACDKHGIAMVFTGMRHFLH